ncbi:MAG: hypothetical protein JWP44_366 [Mucilaginibacter sp.]|nr:hypothetical protein [Mucilaginibacter sp.]
MSTNKATIIYFFERVRIDKGDIVHIQPARSEEPQAIPRLMGISDKAKDLIKNTDIRGQKCRGRYCQQTWRNNTEHGDERVFGKEDDTEHLINEMTRVVKEEIESNEISRVEGTINGTLQFIAGEYAFQTFTFPKA